MQIVLLAHMCKKSLICSHLHYLGINLLQTLIYASSYFQNSQEQYHKFSLKLNLSVNLQSSFSSSSIQETSNFYFISFSTLINCSIPSFLSITQFVYSSSTPITFLFLNDSLIYSDIKNKGNFYFVLYIFPSKQAFFNLFFFILLTLENVFYILQLLHLQQNCSLIKTSSSSLNHSTHYILLVNI